MRRATVRDLRNRFARILTWIEDGERVKVSSRGRVVATLVPERRKARRVSWPDFLARLRTEWAVAAAALRVDRRIPQGRRAVGEACSQHGVPQSRYSARRRSARSRCAHLPDF